MSTSSSNLAVVLDDHKVRDGRIRERLLLGQSVSYGSINCLGENELTAAMMPAVPAPKIATFVFRHVVLEAKGVPKAGI